MLHQFVGFLQPLIYRQHRTAAERLAVATFVRLWDALDRRLFTSDPSPWNVLVHQPDARPGSPPVATIIDLHGLGGAAGTALLRTELPELEAEAKRMRQNLGIDIQQPLVHLSRTLA